MNYTGGYTKWDHKENDDIMKQLKLESFINFISNIKIKGKDT